jgi:hypothetical protein
MSSGHKSFMIGEQIATDTPVGVFDVVTLTNSKFDL